MKTVLAISLDEELRLRVIAEAHRTHQPVSWFVRDVLAEALGAHLPIKRNRSNRSAVKVGK
jgi:hypothetical protein